MASRAWRLAGPLGLALVAAACASSSDATGPNNTPVATTGVSFGYTGAVSGSYAAEGSVDTTTAGVWQPSPFAIAAQDTTGQVLVLAFQQHSGSVGDVALVYLPSALQGTTVQIDSTCVVGGTCIPPILLTDVDLSSATPTYTEGCLLESGSVAVTSAGSGDLAGTFSGTGQCITPTGTVGAFGLTDGSFDVPVLAESAVPSNITGVAPGGGVKR